MLPYVSHRLFDRLLCITCILVSSFLLTACQNSMNNSPFSVIQTTDASSYSHLQRPSDVIVAEKTLSPTIIPTPLITDIIPVQPSFEETVSTVTMTVQTVSTEVAVTTDAESRGDLLLSEHLIAYSSYQEGQHYVIWIADTDTNKKLPLITGRGSIKDLTWSPNGRYIAFIHLSTSYMNYLYVYDILTGQLNKFNPNEDVLEYSWSANSRGFIYWGNDVKLHYLGLNDTESKALVKGYHPVVSPSGELIAFITSLPEGLLGENLALFSVETNTIVDYVIDNPNEPMHGYTAGDINWSWNGQKLLEMRLGSRSSVPALVIYDIHLEKLAYLGITSFTQPGMAKSDLGFCDAIWLKGDQEIAFIFPDRNSYSAGSGCVGKFYISNDYLTEISNPIDGIDFGGPSVSPDGKYITVVRYSKRPEQPLAPGNEYKGKSSLWMMNSDGSNLRLLVDEADDEGKSVWRP